VDRPRRISLRT